MRERTVNFGSCNSWDDFGVIFKAVTISTPEPQLVLVDVPFRDGSLDLTGNFGPLRYKDRTIHMEFLIPWWSEIPHFDIYSRFASELNGASTNITLSSDSDWHYDARVHAISEMANDGGFWGFSLDAVAKPYKIRNYLTQYFTNGGETIVCHNAMKEVMPEIITTGANIQVTYNGKTVTFESTGTHKSSDIVFGKGRNTIAVSAGGTTTIQYREGTL